MRKSLMAATLMSATFLSGGLLLPGDAHATLISIGAATSAGGPITTFATDSGFGFVQASGSLGTFALASATATGAPLLPQPTFNTSSIDISSSAAGSLYVFITEQGLSTPTGVNNFLSTFTFNQITGLISSVTEKTFVSASNLLYSGTQLASVTNTSGLLQTQSIVNATPSLSNPFSETVEYIITASGAGSANLTVNISAVPEPATFAVLGTGLLGLGFLARRRAAI